MRCDTGGGMNLEMIYGRREETRDEIWEKGGDLR